MTLSAAEQYLVELMNRARLEPVAEAARMGIDLNAGMLPGQIDTASKQVLAPNALLEAAASKHSLFMLSADVFSHTGANGSTPGLRIEAEGYAASAFAENLALTGTTAGATLQAQIEEMNIGLFLSAVHRINLMNGQLREVGIGAESGVFTQNGTNFNATALTQDFGTRGTAHFLTGVAYGDTDNDRFYSIGEGTADVVFAAAGQSTATSAAGGYAIALGSGTAVAVTGQVGTRNFALTVDMAPGNVKLDLVSGTTFFTSGSVVLGSGVNNVLLLGVGALNASGNGAANRLTGNAAGNVLLGNGGADVLSGAGGGDTMRGGAGNDRLNGGKGADVMQGGLGLDRFIFTEGNGNDRITDFKLVQGDRLLLDDALWAGTVLNAAGIIANFASQGVGEVVLDFGGGDVIHLVGLSTTAGLGALIDIF